MFRSTADHLERHSLFLIFKCRCCARYVITASGVRLMYVYVHTVRLCCLLCVPTNTHTTHTHHTHTHTRTTRTHTHTPHTHIITHTTHTPHTPHTHTYILKYSVSFQSSLEIPRKFLSRSWRCCSNLRAQLTAILLTGH